MTELMTAAKDADEKAREEEEKRAVHEAAEAKDYLTQKMENNDQSPENGIYGGDVPDELCYQWAEAYFQDPDAKEDGSLVWRCAAFESLNSGYGFQYKCAFYSLKDRERLERYCKGIPESGFFSPEHLQTTIQTRQHMKKQFQKEREIIQRLSVVPALPRVLNRRIHREVIQTFLFYDYNRSKAPQKAYCTTCQKEVIVTGAKHNKAGTCPECQRKAIFKAREKRGYIECRETCQVIQQIRPDELIIRIIKVYYLYCHADIPQKSIVENARCFIRAGENSGGRTEPFYYSNN